MWRSLRAGTAEQTHEFTGTAAQPTIRWCRRQSMRSVRGTSLIAAARRSRRVAKIPPRHSRPRAIS